MNKFFLSYLSCLLICWSCSTTQTIKENQQPDRANIIRDTLKRKYTKKIFSFPKKIYEDSGLETDDGKSFWTFNDSGGKNILYKVNIEGQIIKKLKIENAQNIDWEDIAEDKNAIYIGDFGNNFGNRKDLVIYKILKREINTDSQQKIIAQKIMFDYPDRHDYSRKPYQHDFDCESIFVHNNKIHILSKAWKTGTGKHYILPTVPGKYTATLLEKLPTNGLLTGADIDNDQVFATQYTRDGQVTLWRFSPNKKGLLFKNKVHATYLGNTKQLSQIEGITVYKNNIYISGEGYHGVLPTLYLISDLFEKNN